MTFLITCNIYRKVKLLRKIYLILHKINSKTMQAYEFNTVVRDGIIHIPKQFSEKNLTQVRVILLADTVKKVSEPLKSKFTALRLKTKGFTFNREETHER